MQPYSKEFFNRAVGKQIATQRKALKMSQVELAAKAGVSAQQVSKYEVGNDSLSAYRLWQFANILGCSVLDLYCDIPEVPPGNVAVPEAGVNILVRDYHMLPNDEFRRVARELVAGLGKHLTRGNA